MGMHFSFAFTEAASHALIQALRDAAALHVESISEHDVPTLNDALGSMDRGVRGRDSIAVLTLNGRALAIGTSRAFPPGAAQRLSTKLGRVGVAGIETAGSSAWFEIADAGVSVRSLSMDDDGVRETGARAPEEPPMSFIHDEDDDELGLEPRPCFYMDEIEALTRSLGFDVFDRTLGATIGPVHVIERHFRTASPIERDASEDLPSYVFAPRNLVWLIALAALLIARACLF